MYTAVNCNERTLGGGGEWMGGAVCLKIIYSDRIVVLGKSLMFVYEHFWPGYCGIASFLTNFHKHILEIWDRGCKTSAE